MQNLKKEAEALEEQLISWRRDFHRHPELALEEFRTADIVEGELERLGIHHQRIGKTGVLGILKGEQQGKRIVALRADMDALPIQEQNDVDYRSVVDGVMHACGHDVHTSCLLGAARLLAARKAGFGGEIRFLFQPGEEIGKGAIPFIKAGALKGAERVFGLHTAVDVRLGTVGLTPGLNNASVDHFTIRAHGKSAHVSTPQLGADALYIASQIVVAVQALITRCTSPIEPVIIGIGKLTAGTAYNAVAEEAVLEGTTRTISVETRGSIRKRITELAEQTASMYGGTAELEWEDFASPLINNEQVTKEAAGLVEAIYGPGHVVSNRPLSLGGDDFAEYLLETPGAYAYLGTANPNRPDTQIPAHNGRFNVDEDALKMGTVLYSAYALYWLSQKEV